MHRKVYDLVPYVQQLSLQELEALYRWVRTRYRTEDMLQKAGCLNTVDEIARECGWKPLEVGERMTVHCGNGEYVIERKH